MSKTMHWFFALKHGHLFCRLFYLRYFLCLFIHFPKYAKSSHGRFYLVTIASSFPTYCPSSKVSCVYKSEQKKKYTTKFQIVLQHHSCNSMRGGLFNVSESGGFYIIIDALLISYKDFKNEFFKRNGRS